MAKSATGSSRPSRQPPVSSLARDSFKPQDKELDDRVAIPPLERATIYQNNNSNNNDVCLRDLKRTKH